MQQKNNAVLFDLDGTLINSGLSFLKIVNELKDSESQDHVDFEIVRKKRHYSVMAQYFCLINKVRTGEKQKDGSISVNMKVVI